MQMLYNSDSFAVVQFDMVQAGSTAPSRDGSAAESAPLTHGGYEIVDKFARKEIYLDGALAEQFKLGVDALIETSPSEDDIDDYLSRYTSLAHQTVRMH